MLKLILNLIFILSITVAFAATANQQSSLLNISCSPQLQDSLQTILQLPEARDLISTVQKEGPIRFAVNNTSLSEKFGAFWDMDNRVICVAISPETTQGDTIGSIIFELHNALVHSKLNALDELATHRQISKDKYVESVERLEYENSLKASSLVQKGIRLGLFPKDAHLYTYSSFEEHYRMQRMAGHSSWIGNTYDQLVHTPST